MTILMSIARLLFGANPTEDQIEYVRHTHQDLDYDDRGYDDLPGGSCDSYDDCA